MMPDNQASSPRVDEAVLAIDIGGTNTVLAVVDRRGRILARESIPTGATRDFGTFTAMAEGLALNLLESVGLEKPAAIGIGAPAINSQTGWIDEATDLPWPTPANICGVMAERLDAPAAAINDANAAAAGQLLHIIGPKGNANFIVLTLGTGVGGGVICNGVLLTGSRGFAGELGHMSIPFGEARKCSCGRTDCLQTYASASGVVETAQRILDEFPTIPSKMRDEGISDARTISMLAEDGDPLAIKVWERTGHWLGIACANFAAATDPDEILFFGGVAKSFPLFEKSLKESFAKYALHLNANHTRLAPCSLSEADAALLGAAAAAFDALKN